MTKEEATKAILEIDQKIYSIIGDDPCPQTLDHATVHTTNAMSAFTGGSEDAEQWRDFYEEVSLANHAFFLAMKRVPMSQEFMEDVNTLFNALIRRTSGTMMVKGYWQNSPQLGQKGDCGSK